MQVADPVQVMLAAEVRDRCGWQVCAVVKRIRSPWSRTAFTRFLAPPSEADDRRANYFSPWPCSDEPERAADAFDVTEAGPGMVIADHRQLLVRQPRQQRCLVSAASTGSVSKALCASGKA